MFTIVFTLFGVGVFIFSLFTVKFKMAFIRMLMCVGTGFTLDVLFSLALVALTGTIY